MKICVLSGSPKGKNSITLQTVLYIQKLFPECDFDIIHVGQKIKAYERDMTVALESMRQADMLLFCYPVYTFIAPYQLHRFIELIKESDIDLTGKYAAQITTSKHFYDVTAHKYIKENCFDMGMKYIGGLSADMDDLLKDEGRDDAESFWRYVLYCARYGIYEAPSAKSSDVVKEYTKSLPVTEKRKPYDTVIVTNLEENDTSLSEMIEDFRAVYPCATRVINIADYPFSGGCLGCFTCMFDGKCIYKDNFDTFLRETIQTADAIVYAFTIKDHSMGATFKRYDDRQFCNGHRTVTMGMPMGYIINGDLDSEANLRMIIEGRCEVGHNFLAGCASDRTGIARLSARLVYALDNKLVLPQNFYGVGGMKIFRDLIYLMRGMMKADHNFYKEHGIYDFPQKQVGTMLKMSLVGALLENPTIKSKLNGKITEGMLSPYTKAVNKAIKKRNRH